MKNETNMDKIRHNLDEMSIFIDWISILLRDLTEGYLQPLAYGKPSKEYNIATLIWSEGEAMEEKAEMISRFMSHIADHHRAMSALVFAPDPPNHRDMTRAERIDEIMNDINKAVGLIEDRPDWLETMKELNGKAWALALKKGKSE